MEEHPLRSRKRDLRILFVLLFIFVRTIVEFMLDNPSRAATPPGIGTPTATPTPPIWHTFNTDVILIIDISSSMNGSKLEAAKSTAKIFVGLMDLTVDQAGLV
ncbi:MAG: hypothetical protein DRI80_11065, partial [Chloroflexota bacterium]